MMRCTNRPVPASLARASLLAALLIGTSGCESYVRMNSSPTTPIIVKALPKPPTVEAPRGARAAPQPLPGAAYEAGSIIEAVRADPVVVVETSEPPPPIEPIEPLRPVRPVEPVEVVVPVPSVAPIEAVEVIEVVPTPEPVAVAAPEPTPAPAPAPAPVVRADTTPRRGGTISADGVPGIRYTGGGGAGAGLHVVLIAGDEEYRSEESLPMLARILSAHHGFETTVLFATNPETGEIDPEESSHIPGLSVLDEADMLVLFTRFRRLPDHEMAHIVRYVESGKPILGIRTATHAFAYEAESGSRYEHWTWNAPAGSHWPGGFGREVLGETWVNHHGHHGHQSTRGVTAPGMGEHPILRGVSDVWGPTDVYGIRDLPIDATVLLEGEVLAGMAPDDLAMTAGQNDPRMPLVWARERPLGGYHEYTKVRGPRQRIVCSTIGASVDLANEGLRRLFVNAVLWCVEREEEIPERANVSLVGDYRPTMFGFGSHRRGVRPGDMAPMTSPIGGGN